MKTVKLCFSLLALSLIPSLTFAASGEGLVEKLRSSSNISAEEAKTQIDNVFNALEAELTEGRQVGIRGFGTFHVTERLARKGRNPKTGEAIDIPARKYPRFRSSDVLKKNING